MSDAKLLKQIKLNDEKAYEMLFRKYFYALHEYAQFYTRNSQHAEDIVEDIFMKIWESRHIITINISVKAYLFRSIHNSCIQYLRHQNVKRKYQNYHQAKLEEAQIINRVFFETGITKLYEEEIENLLNEGIEKLPEKTRVIYRLSRKEYLKNTEIAEKIGVTEKTVEYHISRALDALRKYLKDYIP